MLESVNLSMSRYDDCSSGPLVQVGWWVLSLTSCRSIFNCIWMFLTVSTVRPTTIIYRWSWIKVFPSVNHDQDKIKLQDDLNKLFEWSHNWQMPFNVKKYKVVHCGKKRTLISHTSWTGGVWMHKGRDRFRSTLYRRSQCSCTMHAGL